MPKNYSILCILILMLAGCGREPHKNVYQEIVIESPLKTERPGQEDPHASFGGTIPSHDSMSSGIIPNGLLDSRADLPLTWQKPDNWQEFPGSGFRLVTFKATDDVDAIECSIVSLSGPAGGIEANLIRWMTQINLKAPSDGLLDFLKERGAYAPGSSLQFIDFTKLQPELPSSTQSMYVSILTISDSTVFVKITGAIQAIAKYKDEFLSLSKSIKKK